MVIWRSTRSRSVNSESLGGAEKAKFLQYGVSAKFNSLIEAGPVNLVKARRRKHYEVT